MRPYLIYVVEEKRVERQVFFVVESSTVVACFFWRRKLEIKYAIEFSCDYFDIECEHA